MRFRVNMILSILMLSGRINNRRCGEMLCLKKIAGITDRNGILVTYSAKGSVQRALKKNGFEVDLLPGPPGKRQIIRAIKI